MLPKTKISIPLSNDEFAALTRLAVREMRDPRDQARYLLRSALFGPVTDDGPSPENSKIASVKVCTTTTGDFAGVINP